MDKAEIIRRLEKISSHAIHTVGEEPFVMSLDDGITVKEAIDLIKQQPEIVRCKDCKHGDIVDVYAGKMAACRCDDGRVNPLEWFCPDGEVKLDDQ